MNKKISFLCGYFKNLCFIYGVKDKGEWHYFEEADSIIDVHGSLPADLKNRIRELHKVATISITLDASQVANYMVNDKFVFNGRELATFLELSSRSNRKKGSSTDDLVFINGETNPANFLIRFEKCNDVMTDKDKIYKIRNFVTIEDQPEFSKYFFKGKWEAAREAFLKKYSYIFNENKRKALDFQFKKDTSLRSFVHRKIIALSTYTTLSLYNQLEMILAELPSEISCLFTIHLKINATKTEILEFCDTVQDIVEEDENSEASNDTTLTQQIQQEHQTVVVQDLEIFNYHSSDDQTEIESSEEQSSNSSISRRSQKRRRGRKSYIQGGPSKIVRVVAEGTELSQSSTSSVSNF